MSLGNWGGHRRRITKAQRELILQTYLDNPCEGCALALSLGLSQIYPYKLAHERGLLPITRHPEQEARLGRVSA